VHPVFMRDFRNLRAWREARELATEVYAATSGFPREERYGLAAQMRSASVSVGSNLAEGCGRSGPRDFARFISIAAGSASELEFQLDLARSLGLLDGPRTLDLIRRTASVRKMLWGLRHSTLRDPGDATEVG